MSLVDFMQQLQDQDNIVYSEVPEPSIRVIPPEKTCTKIIPPESIAVKPPTTIKLKIKQKQVEIQNTLEHPQENVPYTYNVPNKNVQPTVQHTQQQYVQPVQETFHQPIQQHQTVNSSPPTDDELFIKSGTESSKKSIWIEYYNKAKNSRKSNDVVNRMKIGRFTITPDNKVLLLPDYDVVGKDPDAILKDKWF